jgi:hypothetical protein
MLVEMVGDRPRPCGHQPLTDEGEVIAESRALLYGSNVPAEFALQAGKVQNLRVAAHRLHGAVLPRGTLFGFWAQLGRPTRGRGFVEGRELREGCIVPSVGGGLCQLSNALYDAALIANFAIVERHAHSRRLPGSMAEVGRDATVFWNYVDLRFRPQADIQLDIRLTGTELIVRFRTLGKGRHSVPAVLSPAAKNDPISTPAEVESCETCGVTDCFRHIEPGSVRHQGITAWLLDAWWPEFDHYLHSKRQSSDWLFTPLDSVRLHLGPYRWNSAGFARVRQTPLEVLHRSLVSRRLSAHGAARQRALLRFDESLARRYARALPAEATHLVISQNLLPFLWRDGVLGGRTFDVMMTRLPLAELQATLDRAHASHPESRTLADFRADPGLLADENAALAAADRWITPHSTVASLAGARAVKLQWHIPHSTPPISAGSNFAFPATTIGRKGPYALRAVARQLGLRVKLGGPVLEDSAFWSGVEIVEAGDDWLAQTAAVVLPAWVENQPRRLLQAVAAGIPVIASEACGLAGLPGVIALRENDGAALQAAIKSIANRDTPFST